MPKLIKLPDKQYINPDKIICITNIIYSYFSNNYKIILDGNYEIIINPDDLSREELIKLIEGE